MKEWRSEAGRLEWWHKSWLGGRKVVSSACEAITLAFKPYEQVKHCHHNDRQAYHDYNEKINNVNASLLQLSYCG